MAKMAYYDGLPVGRGSEMYNTLEALKSARKAEKPSKELIETLKTRLDVLKAEALAPFEQWFPDFKPYRVGDHLSEVMEVVRARGYEGVNCEHSA